MIDNVMVNIGAAFMIVGGVALVAAVTFFIIGAIFGIAIKVKRLEEAGYTVTKNDE